MEYGLESLIEEVTKCLESKSDFTGRWCEHYTEECKNKMRDYANTGCLCDNKCEYCDTFKFAVDRAKEYAKYLECSTNDVLKSWEEKRSYWFLNYYQEANQPKLDNVDLIIDTSKDLIAKYGQKGFRCPCCKGVSTDPTECDSKILVKEGRKTHECNWCSYGFISSNYKVLVKDLMKTYAIFKPVILEDKSE